MRLSHLVILPSIFLAIGVAAQNDPPKPKVAKDPLTKEQVEVYRAVLKNYMKDSNSALNVSNRTELLELEEHSFDKECVKGMALERTDNPVVHKLSPAVLISRKMVLVDPEQQQTRVDENDPGKLIQKAVDEEGKVTNKQLDESIRRAFATGLFSLSEIIFDKSHKRAVVSYGFVCGGLCGHGGTLILEKVGDDWKVRTTCSSWIS
jgi:hypothetical protein